LGPGTECGPVIGLVRRPCAAMARGGWPPRAIDRRSGAVGARAGGGGVVCLLAGAGQPAAAPNAARPGKPLPSPDLATGVVVVRVLDGSPDAPHAGATVTLTGDGAPRTARTDDAGRARFEGVTAGATVTARVSGGPVSSEPMVVPDTGGVRVLLS